MREWPDGFIPKPGGPDPIPLGGGFNGRGGIWDGWWPK